MAEPGPIEVRPLRPAEIPAAIGVLARGMRDNPLHVAAYGEDPEWRLRTHARVAKAVFDVFEAQEPLGAVRPDGTLVGVSGLAPPGTCQPDTRQRLRLLPAIIGLGPRTAVRVGRWIGRWAAHDLAEPHAHLGPVAVDAHLQGQGIGSQMMAVHTARLDEQGQLGYLETDKLENVGFYERFGYVVVAEEPVLGVPNWFMRREPAPAAA
jgi:ribosomal protein S18 acetylase RimI-like enzyme